MEITSVEFQTIEGGFALWYNTKTVLQAAFWEKDDLIQQLIETGFIKSSDGTLVTVPVLTTADEYHEETYTLEEFLPMMSNSSWKDVATYIENSKK